MCGGYRATDIPTASKITSLSKLADHVDRGNHRVPTFRLATLPYGGQLPRLVNGGPRVVNKRVQVRRRSLFKFIIIQGNGSAVRMLLQYVVSKFPCPSANTPE